MSYVELVGKKKVMYKAKEGAMKAGFNYYGIKEFNRYETENAECEGKAVIQEWSNIDFDVHPGDIVEFIYEPGFQDKATLVDMRPVAPASSNPFTEKTAAVPDKAADPKDKNKAGA